MNLKEEWRCVITIFGYLYAFIHGVFKMEMWFAKNLAINQQVKKKSKHEGNYYNVCTIAHKNK